MAKGLFTQGMCVLLKEPVSVEDLEARRSPGGTGSPSARSGQSNPFTETTLPRLGTALLPQFLYVISAPRIGPFRTAVAGSVELPCMVLLGLWLFDENPTPSEMLACALLVCASLLVAVSRQPKGQPPAI